MLRISPPGFPKPIWRGWEGGAGSVAGAAVKERLAVAVTTIERSLGGCHKEKVTRDLTDCPGSNQHHYVRQQPHRCEVLPTTTRKRESKGNLTEILQYNITFFTHKTKSTKSNILKNYWPHQKYFICDNWDLHFQLIKVS